MQSRVTSRTRISRKARGFTLVELLTSVAVFGIGATGVIALQTATVAGNAFGSELSTANQIGQSWMDVLSMDAEQWGGEFAQPPPETYWLNYGLQQNQQWFVPEYRVESEIGPAFDSRGQPVETGDSFTRFCTQIRLTWLCQPLAGTCGGTNNVGNGLLRADVRVFWPRRSPEDPQPADFCIAAANPTPDNYHIVGLSSAIKQAANR